MPRPRPDFVHDEASLRRRLRAHLPALAEEPLHAFAEGWDNASFRLGQTRLLRIPRRAASVALLRHEQRWLPTFGALPLPIPRHEHAIVASAPDDLPFSVVPRLPGEPWATAPIEDAHAAARVLGRFLAALHTPAPDEAPRNAFRSCALVERDVSVRAHVAASPVAGGRGERAWARYRSLVAPPTRTWAHGDLHAGNVLVQDGRLAAVIDFGDVCAADRAVDASIGFFVFDDDARAAFFDAAVLDAPTRERAAGWALALGLVHHATSEDDPSFRRLAAHALDRVTAPFA